MEDGQRRGEEKKNRIMHPKKEESVKGGDHLEKVQGAQIKKRKAITG